MDIIDIVLGGKRGGFNRLDLPLEILMEASEKKILDDLPIEVVDALEATFRSKNLLWLFIEPGELSPIPGAYTGHMATAETYTDDNGGMNFCFSFEIFGEVIRFIRATDGVTAVWVLIYGSL